MSRGARSKTWMNRNCQSSDAAANANVIVAVVGHTRGQVGENTDRDSLDLIGGQEKLVEAMQATGKPVVVILSMAHR